MQVIKNHWRLFYFILVTAGLYALVSHWRYDDPFITYRYARNIANGIGFVYNPGERALSTTTPLFTLLLAGFSTLWDNIPGLANLVGAISLALGGVFIWELARAWRTPLVGWVGLLAYPTFPGLLITTGSEIPLYLAFCLGAYASYAQKKYALTAIFAALATLTRPDGLLVPALLAVDYLYSAKRPLPWKAVILFLIPTLLWVSFAWVYFGSPLPVTLAAKQRQAAMPISLPFASGAIETLASYTGGWYSPLGIGLLLVALLGVVHALTSRRQWLIFLAWAPLYFAAYTLLGVPNYFWYYAPLVPGILASVGLGITSINSRWANIVSSQMAHHRARGRFLAALPVLLLAPILHRHYTLNLQWIVNHPDPRYETYHAAGEWLARNTSPDATVGAFEVGIIGYYAQRPMIDFAGLLQPAIGRQLAYSAGYDQAARRAIAEYQPEYLVLPHDFGSNLEGDNLLPDCQPAALFPGPSDKDPVSIVIYTCRP